MTSNISLAHAQAICNTELIAERWRQLKANGHETKTASGWANTLYNLVIQLPDDYRDAPASRRLAVEIAERAVAFVEDLDNRGFAEAITGVPAPSFNGERPLPLEGQ